MCVPSGEGSNEQRSKVVERGSIAREPGVERHENGRCSHTSDPQVSIPEVSLSAKYSRDTLLSSVALRNEAVKAPRRAVDRMAIARCLQQLGHLTMTPVRRTARYPKRPDSEHRERWFDQRMGADSAPPSTECTAHTRHTDPPARERKMLACAEQPVTMPMCRAVGAQSAAAPHDSRPEQCTRPNVPWLRRLITPLISLAKAARFL